MSTGKSKLSRKVPNTLTGGSRKNRGFLFRNGLSVVLLGIMLLAWSGQALTGWKEHNHDLQEEGQPPLEFGPYLHSDHFWAATGENWESEFLQMGMYVLLTIRLFQVGSSESKDPEKAEEVDREPRATPKSPGPVRKGGVALALYQHSLSIAFLVLFLASFTVHFTASLGEYDQQQLLKGAPPVTAGAYITGSHFWFESLQNWQSEFLAVFSIVVLSIWLRQKGSPESKPVDAAHGDTGK